MWSQVQVHLEMCSWILIGGGQQSVVDGGGIGIGKGACPMPSSISNPSTHHPPLPRIHNSWTLSPCCWSTWRRWWKAFFCLSLTKLKKVGISLPLLALFFYSKSTHISTLSRFSTLSSNFSIHAQRSGGAETAELRVIAVVAMRGNRTNFHPPPFLVVLYYFQVNFLEEETIPCSFERIITALVEVGAGEGPGGGNTVLPPCLHKE